MLRINAIMPSLIFYITLFSFFSKISIAVDTITNSKSLGDRETLISAGETFELGFFSRGNSTNWYVGIWYKKISIDTVVWVANRDNPLIDSAGVLRIDGGNLILLDLSGRVVWSTNLTKTAAAQPVAQLLESGNLVIREEGDDNSERFLWQSFDHPTDTFLPGMKLGWNLKTGLNRFLTSWKNNDDPSPGDYTFKMDLNGLPQILLSYKSQRVYRAGPWNGVRFTGIPEMKYNYLFNFHFVNSQDEIYYTYELLNKSMLSRFVLNQTGHGVRYTWLDREDGGGIWNPFWWAPKDQCDRYSECGPYGICNVNYSPVCDCVKGFKPKSPDDWFMRVASGGCVRNTQLNCSGEGFLKLSSMDLPDTSRSFVNKSMSLEECRIECLKDCSCVAYASADIRGGGSGCIRWASDLIDLREYSNGGQDLYIRVPASELDEAATKGKSGTSPNKKRKLVIIIITAVVASTVLLMGIFLCFLWKKKQKGSSGIANSNDLGKEEKCYDVSLFSFTSILAATDNFSDANKLGEGGFGPVYMGWIPEGQKIAVKRLSMGSEQGGEEFKNEVLLTAKLQHTNLVRLLGCCIQGEEKILIYEYMPNNSLDSFIFDSAKRAILDWRKRVHIIEGIAHGLLYLHKYSRLKVIHRDLKASNILLDGEMNPKISDFGMARIFKGNQNQANTRRVVGTYGYMPPEYVMRGLFSEKSDVFSFGVLLLEIVSGKKNTSFQFIDNYSDLLAFAWQLWRQGKDVELMDPVLVDSYSANELKRYIVMGLLCVQECAIDRPTMADVVSMLCSETATLPSPKQPAFSIGRNTAEGDIQSSDPVPASVNDITVSIIEAR